MFFVAVGAIGPTSSASAAAKTTTFNYQCDLTEPFASFAVDGATMLWREPGATSAKRFLLGSLSRTNDGRLAAQTVQGPKNIKAFVITSDVGSDGMSDRTFGSTLEVVAPKSQVGGCSRLPVTYRVHVVSGVEPGDNLNVRSAPSVRGRILSVVAPLGFVWTTGKTQSGWASVGVIVFPSVDHGPAQIVQGWVNARYLSPG